MKGTYAPLHYAGAARHRSAAFFLTVSTVVLCAGTAQAQTVDLFNPGEAHTNSSELASTTPADRPIAIGVGYLNDDVPTATQNAYADFLETGPVNTNGLPPFDPVAPIVVANSATGTITALGGDAVLFDGSVPGSLFNLGTINGDVTAVVSYGDVEIGNGLAENGGAGAGTINGAVSMELLAIDDLAALFPSPPDSVAYIQRARGDLTNSAFGIISQTSEAGTPAVSATGSFATSDFSLIEFTSEAPLLSVSPIEVYLTRRLTLGFIIENDEGGQIITTQDASPGIYFDLVEEEMLNGLTPIFDIVTVESRLDNDGTIRTSSDNSAGVEIRGNTYISVDIDDTSVITTEGDNSPGFLARQTRVDGGGIDIYRGRESIFDVDGTISTLGANAPGIYVDYAESDLRSSADITTSGANSDGIVLLQVAGASTPSMGGNSGRVTVRGTGSVGVRLIGDDLTFTNGGTIVVESNATTAILGDEDGQTVFNAQLAEITGDLLLGGGANVLENYGDIEGGVTTGNGDDDIFNSNRSTVTGSVTMGDGTNSLVNGNIIGGDVVGGAGNDTFTNAEFNILNEMPTIAGDVRLGDGTNSFDNAGAVSGGVQGGSGADTLTSRGFIGGAINLGGGDDGLTILDSAAFGGAIDGGAGTDSVTIVNEEVLTLDQPFSNFETFTKTGAGTLSLSTGVTLGTNIFTVSGGTFVNNGTVTGDLMTANGAILMGTGTTTGTMTINSDFRPGNSIGTAIIAGDLVLGADSVTEIEFDETSFDIIQVQGAGGTTIVDGASLVFVPLNGAVVNNFTFEFIDSDAGVTGSFDEANDVTIAANYSVDAITETVTGVTATISTETSLSGGAISTDLGNGITFATVEGPLVSDFLQGIVESGFAVSSNQQLLSEILQITPVEPGFETGILEAFEGRIYSGFASLATAQAFTVTGAVRDTSLAKGLEKGQWSLWGAPFLTFDKVDAEQSLGSADLETRARGMVGGIAYQLDTDSRVGLFGGGSSVDQEFGSSGFGSSDGSSFFVGIFSALKLFGWDFVVVSGYDVTDLDTDRPVGSFGLTATAQQDVATLMSSLSVRKPYAIGGRVRLEPKIHLISVSSTRDALRETGASFTGTGGNPVTANLTVSKSRYSAIYGEAGGRLVFEDLFAGADPYFEAGYRNILLQTDLSADVNLAGESGLYEVKGGAPSRSETYLGTGFSAELGGGMSVGLDYSVAIGEKTRHSVKGVFRYQFR